MRVVPFCMRGMADIRSERQIVVYRTGAVAPLASPGGKALLCPVSLSNNNFSAWHRPTPAPFGGTLSKERA